MPVRHLWEEVVTGGEEGAMCPVWPRWTRPDPVILIPLPTPVQSPLLKEPLSGHEHIFWPRKS